MSPLFIAAAVVLTIIIGVYVMTRGLPPPLPPLTACKADGDCPHPETCSVASGACVDEILPGLLAAAQSAAQQYYSAFQSILFNLQNVYAAHVGTLVASATAIGLSAPTLTELSAALASGLKDVNAYVQQNLAVPGCAVAKSQSCGYWAEIMALSPSSASATIWSTGAQGRSAPTVLPLAVQAFPSVAASLGDVVGFIAAESTAKRVPLDNSTRDALNAINADIAQVAGYEKSLTVLAAAVMQTGVALYNHYISFG